MGPLLNRYKFIPAIGGMTAAPSLHQPLSARTQLPASRMVGFLNGATAAKWVSFTDAFRAGLKEAGYIEGQNLSIEYRWADGQHDRLPALAAELIGRHVDIITTSGGVAAALAAKALTDTIPIVFAGGNADPVEAGLVEVDLAESASFTEVYRQAGVYAGRMLKGAAPAGPPVVQPARYQLASTSRLRRRLVSKGPHAARPR
jgi:putative ABC transport system substrate-binding protein